MGYNALGSSPRNRDGSARRAMARAPTTPATARVAPTGLRLRQSYRHRSNHRTGGPGPTDRRETMALQQGATASAAPRPRINLWALASYLFVGAAALAPRVLDLGLFITDDEANFWLARSDVFLR